MSSKVPQIRTDSVIDDTLTQPLLSPASSIHELSHVPPSSAPKKLKTISGVFIPVFLSIWGIPFYMRFTIILGNAGVLGMLGMLAVGYLITTITALSMSAISTNGRIHAGGAYFLISRCLGPEFGGAIGTVLYFGTVISIAMNALGFVESLLVFMPNLPSNPWYQTAYASMVLLISSCISSLGSSFFARLNFVLFLIMTISIVSCVGSMICNPKYSPSMLTFASNMPLAFEKDMSLQVLFGIMFPACSGILAGASMSGNLDNASKSIPRGTLWGIAITFCGYVTSILVLASVIPRHVLQQDPTILHAITSPHILFIAGLFSSAFCGVFGGILGAAQLIQAMIVDRLYPGLKPISITAAITTTYSLAQLIIFTTSNLNSLSPFYTQTNLSTYGTLNFACLLLILSGAPNFRPRFKYFGRFTALFGMVLALAAMFVVGVAYAAACILVSAALFALVHYFGEPKNWGDVSHALMYHNVRRMLLKMDRQFSGSQNFVVHGFDRSNLQLNNSQSSANAKLWRPQILLVPPPHTQPSDITHTIRFANDLKKGSLFVLGKLEVGSLRSIGPSNLLKLSAEWVLELETLGAKGFVRMAVDSDPRRGVSGMILGSGIGKLTPNIVMIPFPSISLNNLIHLDNSKPNNISPSPRSWDPMTLLGIIEDILALDKALAVLRNFENHDPQCPGLGVPTCSHQEGNVPVIDLWPMFLTLPVCAPAKQSNSKTAFQPSNQRRPSMLRGFVSLPANICKEDSSTTVPDSDVISSSLDDVATFTLVLQLGYILSRTNRWKGAKVRLFLLVETKDLKLREQMHVTNVLAELRMDDVIELYVVCLEEERLAGIDAGLPVSNQNSDMHWVINDKLSVDHVYDSNDNFDTMGHVATSSGKHHNEGAPTDRVRFKPPRKLFVDPRASSVILEAVTNSSNNDQYSTQSVGTSQGIHCSTNTIFKGNHTTWDEENVLAQASVLQRVVAKYSGSHKGESQMHAASVLLTTLPLYPADANEPGNVSSHVASEYVNVLDTLTLNWPPTVLVAASAGQLSVTTHL